MNYEKINGFMTKLVDELNKLVCEKSRPNFKEFGFFPHGYKLGKDILCAVALIPSAYYSGTDVPFSIKNHGMMNFILTHTNRHDNLVDLIRKSKKEFEELFPKGNFYFKVLNPLYSNGLNRIEFQIDIRFDEYS